MFKVYKSTFILALLLSTGCGSRGCTDPVEVPPQDIETSGSDITITDTPVEPDVVLPKDVNVDHSLPECPVGELDDLQPQAIYSVHNAGADETMKVFGFKARHFYCNNKEMYSMFDPELSTITVFPNGHAVLEGVLHVSKDGCVGGKNNDDVWSITLHMTHAVSGTDDDYWVISKGMGFRSGMSQLHKVNGTWVIDTSGGVVEFERQGITPEMGLHIDDIAAIDYKPLPVYFDHTTRDDNSRIGLASVDLWLIKTCTTKIDM